MVLGGRLAEAVTHAGGANVRLAFFPPTANIETQLESGEVDILVGSEEPAQRQFMRRVLSRRPYRTAQRKGHPRGAQPLDLDGFCALSHMVVPGKESGFECPIDAALERAGRKRHTSVSVVSLAAVPDLLSRTDLVCTLPFPFLRTDETRFDYSKPPLQLNDYILSAFWHARSQVDSGHSWLRSLFFQAAAQL